MVKKLATSTASVVAVVFVLLLIFGRPLAEVFETVGWIIVVTLAIVLTFLAVRRFGRR